MSVINKINVNGTEYTLSGSGGSGLTDDVKESLLDCFAAVAWDTDGGKALYDVLESRLYPPADLEYITCVYTQGGVVYDTDDINTLKNDLVVTAHWGNGTTTTLASGAYTLSGALTAGVSTITVTYGGKTTSFSVTVTEAPKNYIHVWDFTQSMIDSVGGVELALGGGATRDSSGLHFTSINDYVELTNTNVNGYCFEVDIDEYDRQGSGQANVLFGIWQGGNATSGFIYRSSGVWGIYQKNISQWADSSISGANAFDGQTLTFKLLKNENVPYLYVYSGSQLIVAGDMGMSSNSNTYLGTPTASAGSVYNLTITGLRIYEA